MPFFIFRLFFCMIRRIKYIDLGDNYLQIHIDYRERCRNCQLLRKERHIYINKGGKVVC
jgi:hypothetical protein